MSKYVRTKNNVYEVEEEKEYFYITTTGQLPFKKDVIKESDKIEELVDEYVGVYQNICEVVVDYSKWNKYDILYGAIWTDKGLIYVAKMKEKRDLATDMKKKIGDYTFKEAKEYCDDRAKEKGGVYCNSCPFSNVCGDYLDSFDEELEIEIEPKGELELL